MFNFIVSYGDPWPGTSVSMQTNRIFENTDDRVRAIYVNEQGAPNFDALRSLPTIILQEGQGDQVAYVASISRIQRVDNNSVISFSLENDIPPFRNRALFEMRNNFGVGEWEFNRNHWAVKDADLFRHLLPLVAPARRLPSVFQVNVPEVIDRRLVAVMMPFSADFAQVYASIQQAATDAGLNSQRADDMWIHAQLMQDIVSLIDQALVVVCDCTGRNPNVFYEAGIAHTMDREVILIAQSIGDIPFDLRHLRALIYLNNHEGRAALIAGLQARLATIAAR